MKLYTLDFETFWSTSHSLRRMNPIEYVLHPDTQITSVSLKEGFGKTQVVFGEDECRKLFNTVNWGDAFVIGHNMAAFDALVLAWRFGISPKMYGCTMAMARPIHALDVGLSLGKLVEHYGLGVKDNSALIETRGKRLEDFTTAQLGSMRVYNRQDTNQCWGLFQKLLPHYSSAELWHIDSKIRGLVEPGFEVDVPMLERALAAERDVKRKALLELAHMFADRVMPVGSIDEATEDYLVERVRGVLASAPMFSDVLESRGVAVPMKPSPSNPETMIPALAKTDKAFQALAEHEDPIVAAAAEARLQVKSTLGETRMQKFIDVANLTGGKWPVTVHYCGADTTGRASGFHYNPLNMPRVNPHNPRNSDALRMSLKAPPGKVVVHADLSGIEMRVNHYLWQVPYSTALWDNDAKADLYRAAYAMKLGIPPEEVTSDQRTASKVENLALGFGMGHVKFVDQARILGGLEFTLEDAQITVRDWRGRHPEIAGREGGWALAERALAWVYEGIERPVDPDGLLITCPEGIRLPSGRLIRYPNLHRERTSRLNHETGEVWDSTGWAYASGRHKTNIYGGKSVENYCIAEGTLVLTQVGWTPIERIQKGDLVHDGVEFVAHDGVVPKGVKGCTVIDGVGMTPDHEVLTDDGWKEASQLPRPYRPSVRSTDRLAAVAHRRKEMALGIPVSVWSADHQDRRRRDEGGEARGDTQLRVHDISSDVRQLHEQDPRHVPAPRLLGVAQHARQVQTAIASGVAQLRSAGHHCMRAVGRVVRGVLGGHGRHVLTGAGHRAGGQRRAVLTEQLCVGHAPSQHHEPTKHHTRSRLDETVPGDGHRVQHAALPTVERVAGGGTDKAAIVFQSPTYDIMNCGPRQRFVVLGNDGPFIVHNCQALARDVVYDVALNVFEATGYRPALEVYDELVYVVPEKDAELVLDTTHHFMRHPVAWFPRLVTWSEGGIYERYGQAD